MGTGFRDIQELVDDIVAEVAGAVGADVCVVDREMNLVACTPGFQQRKGRVRPEFLLPLLDRPEPNLLAAPGSHPLCAGCALEHNCPHTFELDVPIPGHNQALGMLSIVAFTADARQRIMDQGQELVQFVAAQARLIGHELLRCQAERSVAFLEAVLGAIQEGVALVDPQGCIISINEGFRDLTGLDPTVIGQRVDRLLPDVPRPDQWRAAEGAGRRRAAAGPARNTVFSIRPVDWHGQLLGGIVVLHTSPHRVGPEEEPGPPALRRIVGKAPALLAAKAKAQRVAGSPATVLLMGETGTGKELFARALHDMSPRRSRPFVAINCASIPETLLESELFGYDGGAFTGARKGGKPGKIEQAQGGTLFLDEIGDMPLSLQSKLLRVLEDRQIERVGSTQSLALDVRIVSATNAALEQMVREGRFRSDLYYRLAVVPILLPPLRERRGDVAMLARHLLAELSLRHERPGLQWSSEALRALEAHDWPGNVRELANAVEYAVHLCAGLDIQAIDLPPAVASLGDTHETVDPKTHLTAELDLAERKVLETALQDGLFESRSAAARSLGISRSSLYRKLRKHGLD